MALTAKEKERLLKALEEDREFRYALMGLLGFKEVLERITKLEEGHREILERIARIEERQQKLEERQQKLEEKFAQLEERVVRLEERFAKLEERFAKLEERFAKLEERFIRLEERQQKLEERLLMVEEELVRLRKLWEASRRDIGALTEVLYTRIAWEYLKEELDERGERVLRKRRNAVIGGVEIDLLVETDKALYAVEVKVQPNHHDVREVASKAAELKSKLGKEVVPVLAGTWVGSELRQLAERYGVRIVEY